MYERFYGLRERPFDLAPNPRFLVLTDSHREVLSNLEYAIASRKGVTVVIGEAGSGKTTLIRSVLQRQPEEVHTVHLTNPTLSREEFVETLAAKFNLSEAAGRSKATMLAELEELLHDRRTRREVTVLIIDEAQSVPRELLEEVRLLANIEADDERLISVILAGQPELADRLDEPALRQLKQRVALRCRLRPLTDRETAGYIAGRIAAAGGIGGEVFTREAVTLIHEASAGLPRTISVLADNTLLGGFAAGVKPVRSRIVREVCRDFGLPLAGNEDVTHERRPGPSILKLNGFDASDRAAAAPAAPETISPDSEPGADDKSAGWFSWGRRRRIGT